MEKEGFNLWKNCAFVNQQHETILDHGNSSLKFKLKKRSIVYTNILPALESQQKMEILMNWQVMTMLIYIVLHLARHDNAFRSHRDNGSSE